MSLKEGDRARSTRGNVSGEAGAHPNLVKAVAPFGWR